MKICSKFWSNKKRGGLRETCVGVHHHNSRGHAKAWKYITSHSMGSSPSAMPPSSAFLVIKPVGCFVCCCWALLPLAAPTQYNLLRTFCVATAHSLNAPCLVTCLIMLPQATTVLKLPNSITMCVACFIKWSKTLAGSPMLACHFGGCKDKEDAW